MWIKLSPCIYGFENRQNMKTTILKSEKLKGTVEREAVEKLKSDKGITADINKIDIEGHTPYEETDESIEKWESVTCKASGRFGIETEEKGYYEQPGKIIISADIKSYDPETGEFTVDIPNTPIIEQYP